MADLPLFNLSLFILYFLSLQRSHYSSFVQSEPGVGDLVAKVIGLEDSNTAVSQRPSTTLKFVNSSSTNNDRYFCEPDNSKFDFPGHYEVWQRLRMAMLFAMGHLEKFFIELAHLDK